MRCPRCLSEGYRGVTSCPVCQASFSLQAHTAIYYPTLYHHSMEPNHKITVNGVALTMWIPKPNSTAHTPVNGDGLSSLHWPGESSGSVNKASSASAAPSFISKEVADIFEENHTWITRLPAISVDDQEVVRYFSEYLNNVFRSNIAARYVANHQWMLRGGRAEGKGAGFVPSSWSLSHEDELKILTTPTSITSDAHLAAMQNVAYLTQSRKTLEALLGNKFTSGLTCGSLQDHMEGVVVRFLSIRQQALMELHGEGDRSYLKFDFANKRMGKERLYTVFRFPVLPEYGSNTDLSFTQNSDEYVRLCNMGVSPDWGTYNVYLHGMCAERTFGIMSEGGMRPSLLNIKQQRQGVYAVNPAEQWCTAVGYNIAVPLANNGIYYQLVAELRAPKENVRHNVQLGSDHVCWTPQGHV